MSLDRERGWVNGLQRKGEVLLNAKVVDPHLIGACFRWLRHTVGEIGQMDGGGSGWLWYNAVVGFHSEQGTWDASSSGRHQCKVGRGLNLVPH